MSAQPAKRFDADSYVPVSERIEQFYAKFPEGRILTAIVEHDAQAGFVLMRAEVYRGADDAQPAATGHAFESKDAGYVQKTSYVEVGETSAVGRALMLLNFETKRGLVGREDVQKRPHAPERTAKPTEQTLPPGVAQGAPRILNISEIDDPQSKTAADMITQPQRTLLKKEAETVGVDPEQESRRVYEIGLDQLSRAAAAALIKHVRSGAPDQPA